MSGRGLPTGWVVVPLAEIANSQLGKMLDKAKRTAGTSLPYLRNVNVRWGEFDLSDLSEMPFTADELDRFGLCDGDVLICEGGEPGRAAIWRGGNTPIKFQKALHRVRLQGGCDPRWLTFHLRKDAAAGELSNYFTGTTIKHFTGEALRHYPVALPPLPEQRRIVEKTEALTARSRRAREALDALPALIDRYRQSVLAAAFRGDLTADWREMHDDLQPISDAELSGLRRQLWDAVQERVNAGRKSRYQSAEDIAQEGAELPEGWRWVSVDELCPIVQYGTSAKTTEQDGVVVLRMGNIQSGTIVFDSIKSLPEEHEEFPALLLERGDLLFNRTNSPELVGKSAVFDGYLTPCSFASYLIRLKVAGLNPRLLAAYINSPFGRMWARSVVSQQVGQANINGSKLKALAVPLPPAEEQEQILRKLKAHDEAIARVIDQHCIGATRLATLDQSILAKAFRGELVPQDPNDEPASVLLERIRAERAAAGPAPRRGRRPKAAGDN